MHRFIAIVERTAGMFLGLVAIVTFSEAVLRYLFNSHIPDGFIIGQTMQGVAICWGIATATYADRHITVDIAYEVGPAWMRRLFDVVAQTLSFLFMALFGYAITFKVFDILGTGEISSELHIPIWIGYTFASLGILAAVVMGGLRWWQVVVLGRSGAASNG